MTAYALQRGERLGLSQERLKREAVASIVLAALLFNFLLCFVYTNVARIGSAVVVLSELCLIATTLLLVVNRAREIVVLIGAYVAYSVFLGTLQGAFDPKPVRDILIPIAFYYAGREFGTLRTADRVVSIAAYVVLAAGLFEYFLFPLYIKLFDIIGYYVSRGSVTAATADMQSDRLFVSGMRYEGRTLLPFLGEHRVSSVFLEPVSVGNFVAVTFAWVVLRRWGRPLAILAGLLPIVTICVFADARFGLFVSLASIPIFYLARRVHWIMLLLAPLLVATVLAFVGFTYPDVPWDNTLKGRLLLCGQMLAGLTPAELFAFVRVDRFTSDSGYTYTFTQIGLIGFTAMWALFVVAPCRTLQAWRFKMFVAAYLVLLLTISNSVYSIKTAALVWYLVGTLARGEMERID